MFQTVISGSWQREISEMINVVGQSKKQKFAKTSMSLYIIDILMYIYMLSKESKRGA